MQKNTVEDERAEHVIFVIITAGMENASSQFKYEKVRQMIEHQKSRYGWEFIFLGENIDAIDTAKCFGTNKDRASNYYAAKKGILLNYEVISETISCMRASYSISENWKNLIEEDLKKRGDRK